MATWLLSLFLALTPVYWIPGVPKEVLLAFEWSILLAALVLVFRTARDKGRLPWPAGFLGPLGFAGILLLWAPGLLQAGNSFQALLFVAQTGFYLAFFSCFFCIARDGGDVFAIFRRAFFLVALLAGVALVLLALDSGAPYAIDSNWAAGFDGTAQARGRDGRTTGWSMRLGLFLPAAALWFLPSQVRRPSAWKSLATVGAMVLIGNQLISGSRGGLLVSAASLGTFALLRWSKRLAAVAALASLIMIGAIYAQEPGKRPLRIVNSSLILKGVLEKDSAWDRDDIMRLSSARYQSWVVGLEKIAERPLLGHGLRQAPYQHFNKQLEIHNLWIKWAAYTGVLAPVWLLFMMALILRAGWRALQDAHRTAAEREGVAVLGLVVAGGLFLSMIEPNVPLGVFQGFAVWWAAAGALVGFAARPAPPPGA